MLLHHPYLTSPHLKQLLDSVSESTDSCWQWCMRLSNLLPRMIWCKRTLRLSSITHMVILLFSTLTRAAQKKPDCYFICPGSYLIKSIEKWQLHSRTSFYGRKRASPGRNCTTVQETISKVEGRECLGFVPPCLCTRHVCLFYLFYLFVTSNTLLQKRLRAEQQKHCVKWK